MERYHCDICDCEISAEEDHEYDSKCWDCHEADERAFWNSLTKTEKDKINKDAML